jgi:Flp pilus assembly protein TadB
MRVEVATSARTGGHQGVRALKTVFAGLFAIAIIVGGLFVAALVAVAGIAVLIVNHLFGRSVSLRSTSRPRRTPQAAETSEVIDVVAAEIPDSRKTGSGSTILGTAGRASDDHG